MFLQDSLTQVQIGWIGFGGNLAGAVGGVMAGMLIDRFDQSLCACPSSLLSRILSRKHLRNRVQNLQLMNSARRKWGMVALYTAATASAVLFLVFVYVLFRTLPFVPIFLAVLFTMFFANAAAPICLELASELTYPVGEETSATLLVVASMAVMVAFMLFADLISPVAMNWINAVRATTAFAGSLLPSDGPAQKAARS